MYFRLQVVIARDAALEATLLLTAANVFID
jgi:hypothetical protein